MLETQSRKHLHQNKSEEELRQKHQGVRQLIPCWKIIFLMKKANSGESLFLHTPSFQSYMSPKSTVHRTHKVKNPYNPESSLSPESTESRI